MKIIETVPVKDGRLEGLLYALRPYFSQNWVEDENGRRIVAIQVIERDVESPPKEAPWSVRFLTKVPEK